MSTDLFEQLSQTDIPPAPETLEVEVHRRVNNSLLVIHLVDFALRAMPLVAFQFARAVFGMIGYTITGRYRTPQDSGSRDNGS